jgi:hypothetical protein
MNKSDESEDMDNESFDGQGPVHCRRPRPTRGPLDDELSENSDNGYGDATDALLNIARNELILPIPFAQRTCETCLQNRKGDFILLNLNAALHHAKNHHQGVEVLYACKKCGKTYKTKHSAE